MSGKSNRLKAKNGARLRNIEEHAAQQADAAKEAPPKSPYLRMLEKIDSDNAKLNRQKPQK